MNFKQKIKRSTIGHHRVMVDIIEVTSSDDELYDAVDLISDSSDEGDTDVERAEERNIICSEENDKNKLGKTGGDDDKVGAEQKKNDDDDVLENEDVEQHDGEVPDEGGVHLSEVECAHTNPYFASEMEMFQAAKIYDRAASETALDDSHRHVRFREEESFQEEEFFLVNCMTMGSDEEDDEDDGLADVYMQQDQLDPEFRSMIENDEDEDRGEGDENGGETSSNGAEAVESSGYESQCHYRHWTFTLSRPFCVSSC